MTPVVRLARTQGGVLAAHQLEELGVPRSSFYDACREWELARPHRGVVALPGADLDAPMTRNWVAICAVGRPAWIGGLASLAVRGIVRDPATVHVTVHAPRKPSAPRWVRVRRLDLDHDDVDVHRGLPVLTVRRTLSEVAATEPYPEALGAVAASLQRRATTLDELAAAADRVRTGARALRRVVHDLRGSRAQSALAHRVTLLLGSNGMQVRAEVPVSTPSGSFRIDLVVDGTTVAIEVDGHATHHGRWRLAADRRRQNALVLDGWTVLRVDWLRLERDADGFVDEVRRAVREQTA